MSHDEDIESGKERTPEEQEILEKAEEAARKYAEKHCRQYGEHVPDEDEPEGLLAGGPEYLDADLDDDKG